MEAGKTDKDYDEFDKLLGEIPNATIGNPYTREPVQSSDSPGFEPISVTEVMKSSASSSLFNTPQAVKGGDNISMDNNFTWPKTPLDQEDKPHHYHGASTASINYDALNLSDNQFLASAFEDMSLKDRIAANSTKPLFEHNRSSCGHAFSLDGHYLAHINKFSSGLESTAMSILPPCTMLDGVHQSNLVSEGDSPFITKNEVNIHNRMVDGHNDGRCLELNFHDPRNQVLKSVLDDHRYQRQSFKGGCSAAMPVNPGMHTFFLPGVLTRGFEFSASPFQQEYCLDSPCHSNIPYQQLSQSNMVWYDMEGDRNYRSHHQSLYFQQLESQCLEGHIQRRRTSATGPLSGNARLLFSHTSIPHQAGQGNPDSYENDNVANRRYNQLDHSLLGSNLDGCHLNGFSCQCMSCLFLQGQKLPSSCGFYCPGISSHGHQYLDRFGKQTFPEKILTRAHGVNSLGILESCYIGSTPLAEHADNTRRVFPNSNVHSCLVQCDESLNLGVWRSRGSSPDNSDQKHDLKSPHLKYDTLNHVTGQIYMLAKDQNGCRFLQRIFEEGNREDVDQIFFEIIDHVVELMTDLFGNYLVQKLVEVCTKEQITHIIHEISRIRGEFFRISCNQQGTRVVQKIIETVKSPEQYSMIVLALEPDMVSLIKNNNGSHVAQRCLQYLSPECREFLFEAAVATCIELARDRQGCCVLQKCLTGLDGEQKIRLISKLTSNARELAQDPYGNYVVQYVLDQEVPWAITMILNQLDGHYQALSVQKYSSNVVEKCLKFAGDDRRVTIISELINDPHFVQIVQDPYGNYVIQSAIRECKGALRAALNEAIKRHEWALRISPYGKKVLSSMLW